MPCVPSPTVLALTRNPSCLKGARMAELSPHVGLLRLAGMQYSNLMDSIKRE